MKKTGLKHRKKTLLIKIMATVFALIMIFTLIPVNSTAKTFKRSSSSIGVKKMDPTGSELKNLSGSDAVKGTTLSKSVCLSAYSFVAYKFTEDGLPSHDGPYPTSGWYSFRTSGNQDTVGELYKTNYVTKGWPWNWHYDSKRISLNDDSSNYGINCEIVYRMEENETVYFCCRLYGGRTGSFDVIVEPYRDVKTSYVGGYWAVDDDGMVNIGDYYDCKVVKSKLYLTKEQVASMYEMYRQMIAGTVISKQRIKRMFMNQEYSAAVESLYTIYGDILLSFAPPWMTTLKNCVGKIAEYLSPAFAKAMNLMLGDEEEYADVCINLEDVGGAKYENGKCTATDGIVITRRFENTLFGYEHILDYSVYNETKLYGSEYERGTWIK